jgi:hypothetical protein
VANVGAEERIGEQASRNHDPCISCATHFLELTVDREPSSAQSVAGAAAGSIHRFDAGVGLSAKVETALAALADVALLEACGARV